MLKTGYIDELKLSVAEVALRLGVSRKTIYDIINCNSAITPVMALKIAKAFNSDAEFRLMDKYKNSFTKQFGLKEFSSPICFLLKS